MTLKIQMYVLVVYNDLSKKMPNAERCTLAWCNLYNDDFKTLLLVIFTRRADAQLQIPCGVGAYTTTTNTCGYTLGGLQRQNKPLSYEQNSGNVTTGAWRNVYIVEHVMRTFSEQNDPFGNMIHVTYDIRCTIQQ